MKLATPEDIRHIGETMWERGKTELSALGIGPQEWVDGWRARILRGDAYCFDGHAILGCDWEATDICNTSFQASTSFEAPGVGRQITSEIRDAIPGLMKECGAKLAYTYSLCVDPSAEKWFRLLGLEEDVNFVGGSFGPYIMRRFFRRA